MNQLFIVVVCIVGVSQMQATETKQKERYAISGCCKERQGARWINVSEDFRWCAQKNALNDGDDLYSPENKYWWDIKC